MYIIQMHKNYIYQMYYNIWFQGGWPDAFLDVFVIHIFLILTWLSRKSNLLQSKSVDVELYAKIRCD